MCLAHYDAYFHINDDAKKYRYLCVTNNLIFSLYSFNLLSHEVLLEVCFAMDTLMKLFVSVIRVNFINLIKSFVYCRFDENIRSAVDLLIKDY